MTSEVTDMLASNSGYAPHRLKRARKLIERIIKRSLATEAVVRVGDFEHIVGIALVTIKKGGVLMTGEIGRGMFIGKISASANVTQRWTGPIFLSFYGGEIGLNVGISKVDHFLMFYDEKSFYKFLKEDGDFKIGLDAGIDGAVGRETTERKDVKVYAISSKGLYIGASLEGKVIKIDKDKNSKYYGQDWSIESILTGITIPPKNNDYSRIIQLLDEAAYGVGNKQNYAGLGSKQPYETATTDVSKLNTNSNFITNPFSGDVQQDTTKHKRDYPHESVTRPSATSISSSPSYLSDSSSAYIPSDASRSNMQDVIPSNVPQHHSVTNQQPQEIHTFKRTVVEMEPVPNDHGVDIPVHRHNQPFTSTYDQHRDKTSEQPFNSSYDQHRDKITEQPFTNDYGSRGKTLDQPFTNDHDKQRDKTLVQPFASDHGQKRDKTSEQPFTSSYGQQQNKTSENPFASGHDTKHADYYKDKPEEIVVQHGLVNDATGQHTKPYTGDIVPDSSKTHKYPITDSSETHKYPITGSSETHKYPMTGSSETHKHPITDQNSFETREESNKHKEGLGPKIHRILNDQTAKDHHTYPSGSEFDTTQPSNVSLSNRDQIHTGQNINELNSSNLKHETLMESPKKSMHNERTFYEKQRERPTLESEKTFIEQPIGRESSPSVSSELSVSSTEEEIEKENKGIIDTAKEKAEQLKVVAQEKFEQAKEVVAEQVHKVKDIVAGPKVEESNLIDKDKTSFTTKIEQPQTSVSSVSKFSTEIGNPTQDLQKSYSHASTESEKNRLNENEIPEKKGLLAKVKDTVSTLIVGNPDETNRDFSISRSLSRSRSRSPVRSGQDVPEKETSGKGIVANVKEKVSNLVSGGNTKPSTQPQVIILQSDKPITIRLEEDSEKNKGIGTTIKEKVSNLMNSGGSGESGVKSVMSSTDSNKSGEEKKGIVQNIKEKVSHLVGGDETDLKSKEIENKPGMLDNMKEKVSNLFSPESQHVKPIPDTKLGDSKPTSDVSSTNGGISNTVGVILGTMANLINGVEQKENEQTSSESFKNKEDKNRVVIVDNIKIEKHGEVTTGQKLPGPELKNVPESTQTSNLPTIGNQYKTETSNLPTIGNQIPIHLSQQAEKDIGARKNDIIEYEEAKITIKTKDDTNLLGQENSEIIYSGIVAEKDRNESGGERALHIAEDILHKIEKSNKSVEQ